MLCDKMETLNKELYMSQVANKQIQRIDKKIKRTEKKIQRRIPSFLYEPFENHYDRRKVMLRKKVEEYLKEKSRLQDEELKEELKRSR